MKLLILTQKVDRNDPILGFFHRWVEEFAKHAEGIVVICLEKGEYNLPKNVEVLSLGKEEDVSRLTYIIRFYKYIWQERKNYDSVFVHMNQEYVLLGGIFWKMKNKKVLMWRNHPEGSFLTDIAMFFSDKVLYTSTFSYTAKHKHKNKGIKMPAGIDTRTFYRDKSIVRKKKSILFLSRISPIKRPDILIDALSILDKSGVDFTASIYGDSLDKDVEYYKKIRGQATSLEEKGKIVFHKGVPNMQVPDIYNQHELFVNATPSGSFDKAILEAMASGCITIVFNQSFKNILSEQLLFNEGSSLSLYEKLRTALSFGDQEREKHEKDLNQYVTQHDISALSSKLFNILK